MLLLSGQFVSQIGDKFHMLAISFWVLKTTGSSAQMGAVLAASLLPSIIIGLFSGVFIDRYHRKWIIVGTDLFRGVIIGVFSVLFYLDMINLPIILTMQVLLSVNAAFFDPAIPAIIPTIVDAKDLTKANSRHQFINGFSTIAGAFLGGILVSVFGYLTIFVLNAVSFIFSAGFECFIHIPETRKRLHRQTRIIQDMQQGYVYLFSKSNFIVLLLMVMVIHFFVGSIEVMMPIIAATVSNDGAQTLGFFQAAFGFGTIAMAFFLSMAVRMKKEKPWLFGAVFCIGIAYIIGACIDSQHTFARSLFLMMLFLLGGCIICAGIAFRSLLQKSIDNNFAGRVFGVAGTVANASIPAAMIIYGFMLEYFSYQGLLMVSGLVLLPLSAFSFLLYKEDSQ